MSSLQKPTIPCAVCGRASRYFDEPIGPFCSARCQAVDLGKWLAEEYSISEPLRPEHLAAYEELSDPARLDRPEAED